MILYGKDGEREQHSERQWRFGVRNIHISTPDLSQINLTSSLFAYLLQILKVVESQQVLMSGVFNLLNICISITFQCVKEEKQPKEKKQQEQQHRKVAMTFITRVPQAKLAPMRIHLSSIVQAVDQTGKFKLWSRQGIKVIYSSNGRTKPQDFGNIDSNAMKYLENWSSSA